MEVSQIEIKDMIDCIFSDYNQARKYEHVKYQDFYDGNHREYILRKATDCYGKDYCKSQQNFTAINITPKIINDKARVYERSPYRTINNTSEDISEAIIDFYKNSHVDSILQYSNILMELHGQSLIHIYPSQTMLEFKVYNPSQYDVLPDPENPGQAKAIIIPIAVFEDVSRLKQLSFEEDNRKFLRFSWWTDTCNFMTDGFGRLVGDEVLHNLGRLPFVQVKAKETTEYWASVYSDVVEFAEQFACYDMDIKNISINQGFAQAVISAEKAPETLYTGPTTVIHLPIDENSTKDPKFEFVSPNANISGLLECRSSLLSTFLSAQGLESDLISLDGSSRTFSSGIERFMAQVQRFEASESSRKIYEFVENDIYELLRLWYQSLVNTSIDIPVIPIDSSINLTFHGPEALLTQQEELSNIDTKLRLGIIDQAEAISICKGITLEEARDEIAGRGVSADMGN